MLFFHFKESKIDKLNTYYLYRLRAHYITARVPNLMGFKAIKCVCLSLYLVFLKLLQNACIMEAQIFRDKLFWGSIVFSFKKS